MIKERHLVPGRVLALRDTVRRPIFNKMGNHVRTEIVGIMRPCMVICAVVDVNRRHWRSTAPKEGWDVLVIWLGGHRPSVVEQVRIRAFDQESWQCLW